MKPKTIAQGAEAKIILSNNLVTKDRISKSYRIPELDKKIRKQRTKSETKLLTKASKIINCPIPSESKEFDKIVMPYIKGKKLSEHLDKFPLSKQKQICKKIGEDISKLHNENIIHGDLTTSNMILVDGTIDKKLPNFNKLLSKLKKLNLPKDQFAIFASGSLAIRGLKDVDDLDILVTPNLFNKLSKKYSVKKLPLKYGDLEIIKINNMEISNKTSPNLDGPIKLIKEADIINNIRFVKLEYLLKCKKTWNRAKDKKDIKIIKDYISLTNSSSEKSASSDFAATNRASAPIIFFIDFGLGYFNGKYEDKAVDLHLLKQALEAKHFKNWEELWKNVEVGYKKSKEAQKVLERLIAVERRGRYKH